jgi:hypothetical protein
VGFSAEAVYEQPQPFGLLDDFINGDPEPVSSFHADLQAALSGPRHGSANYGPFADDAAMQAHWSQDWTNWDGYGGRYWPYLHSVSIHTLLTEGLIRSIGVALEPQRKQHATIWAPILDAPESGAASDLTESAQRRLFKVAVHQTENTVQLVIVTPAV